MSENFNSLKKKLDKHYKSFNKTTLTPDPLEFPRTYSDPDDMEIIAFISSLFAYGGVNKICKILVTLTKLLGEHPNQAIKEKKLKLDGLYYRFYSNQDIIDLFKVLGILLKKHGNIENIFKVNFDGDLKAGIEGFSNYFLSQFKKTTRGIRFMFPLPSKNSACKRFNLFLRWVVRNDELDLGLWKCITPDKLIIPVDTHIARISKNIGLTDRSIVSWGMANQITENLRLFDKKDPIKYDFALCHIGIRKLEL